MEEREGHSMLVVEWRDAGVVAALFQGAERKSDPERKQGVEEGSGC